MFTKRPKSFSRHRSVDNSNQIRMIYLRLWKSDSRVSSVSCDHFKIAEYLCLGQRIMNDLFGEGSKRSYLLWFDFLDGKPLSVGQLDFSDRVMKERVGGMTLMIVSDLIIVCYFCLLFCNVKANCLYTTTTAPATTITTTKNNNNIKSLFYLNYLLNYWWLLLFLL